MIVQSLLRQAFSRITAIGSDSTSELQRSIDESRGMPSDMPSDTRVFKLNESLFFPNAQRVKQQILDSISTHHSSQHSSMYGSEAERTWSVVGPKRILRLRKDAGVHDASDLPPIRVVILDFSRVNHFDVTAHLKLREFLAELRKYAGDTVEVRFVGLAKHVRDRFDRARPSWNLVDGRAAPDSSDSSGNKDSKTEEIKVFRTVGEAVSAMRTSDVDQIMEEKMKIEHKEGA
jgi:solute carrier family 26 (sodium-independent sulfate anion transporter), member 11